MSLVTQSGIITRTQLGLIIIGSILVSAVFTLIVTFLVLRHKRHKRVRQEGNLDGKARGTGRMDQRPRYIPIMPRIPAAAMARSSPSRFKDNHSINEPPRQNLSVEMTSALQDFDPFRSDNSEGDPSASPIRSRKRDAEMASQRAPRRESILPSLLNAKFGVSQETKQVKFVDGEKSVAGSVLSEGDLETAFTVSRTVTRSASRSATRSSKSEGDVGVKTWVEGGRVGRESAGIGNAY
jgi:hypothetical protein